jgi:hypothetical protein
VFAVVAAAGRQELKITGNLKKREESVHKKQMTSLPA